MNKLIIDNNKFKGLILKICRDVSNSGWRPDYIVGITRGGLIPAVMISHYLGVPMKSLDVSLRDGGDCVSNCGMAEDALGYPKQERSVADKTDTAGVSLLKERDTFKNILVVDDINDTGATFNWIMQDWPNLCLPNDEDWKWVWNNNVRFAVVVDNLSSKCNVKIDYSGMEVNKAENDVWIDFPWEIFWTTPY